MGRIRGNWVPQRGYRAFLGHLVSTWVNELEHKHRPYALPRVVRRSLAGAFRTSVFVGLGIVGSRWQVTRLINLVGFLRGLFALGFGALCCAAWLGVWCSACIERLLWLARLSWNVVRECFVTSRPHFFLHLQRSFCYLLKGVAVVEVAATTAVVVFVATSGATALAIQCIVKAHERLDSQQLIWLLGSWRLARYGSVHGAVDCGKLTLNQRKYLTRALLQ